MHEWWNGRHGGLNSIFFIKFSFKRGDIMNYTTQEKGLITEK